MCWCGCSCGDAYIVVVGSLVRLVVASASSSACFDTVAEEGHAGG